MNIDPLVLAVGAALVFSAGATFGAWFVQRPARRRAREIELADNMNAKKRGER